MKKNSESISNKEYRQREGLSASDLKRMVKSMAHWKYAKDNPEDADSPALLFGRALHKLVLEPSDFDNEFVVSPKFDRRTKEGKAQYEKFLEDSKGKDIIDEETMQTLCDMRDSLYATPFVKKLINGEHEKSFFWEDSTCGIPCKCRPDSFGKINGNHIIVDLKTCSDAETSAFMRDSQKFGYDIQAAHYCEGLKQIYGEDFSFVFIAVEKKPPYAVNILQADEYFLANGLEVRNALLETYKKCVELNEFPGYMGFSEDKNFINTLSVAKWLKNAIDSESFEVESEDL